MINRLIQRVPERWRRYVTPGPVPNPTTQKELRAIYGLWLIALVLKMIGSTWDVAWHYRFLRDDLAPPHNINTVGTIMVVMLVLFHTWTGLGIDKRSLRWVQVGIGTFLLAIPLDLINHRVFGLDITAWSPTHMMLYVGTAIMLVGVLLGWSAFAEPGRARHLMGLGFWMMLFEDLLFPLGQHEYGVLSRAALLSGKPTAGPDLLAYAYEWGNGNPEQFILPVPTWVYPMWLIPVSVLVLVTARIATGWRWTATTLAATYVGYRIVAYYMLLAGDFPPSSFPWILIGGGMLVDLAVNYRWHPLASTAAVMAWFYGVAMLLGRYALIPEFSLYTAPMVAMFVGVIWFSVQRFEQHSLVRQFRTAYS